MSTFGSSFSTSKTLFRWSELLSRASLDGMDVYVLPINVEFFQYPLIGALLQRRHP